MLVLVIIRQDKGEGVEGADDFHELCEVVAVLQDGLLAEELAHPRLVACEKRHPLRQ